MAGKLWTDAKVRALRPTARKRYESIDRGLRLCVYPTGAKAWFYRHKIAGKEAMLKVADYGEGAGQMLLAAARMRVDELQRQAQEAREGRAAAPKQTVILKRAERLAEPTVRDLFAKWLASPRSKRRADGTRTAVPVRESTATEYRRMFNTDAADIVEMKAHHVTHRHVRGLIDKIQERGAPVAASETFKMLRAMFKFAAREGYLEVDPIAGMRVAAAERSKERWLKDAELLAFFQLLAGDSTRVGTSTCLALRWVLVTACRPGEARGARWSEIDEAAGTWTIPGERTKNGRAHVVTLSDAMLTVLTEAEKVRESSPMLFPGLVEGEGLSDQALSHAVRRLRPRLEKVGVIEPFTPHDLRRTATTIITNTGASRFIASLVLNHISETEAGVTAVYDQKSYAAEMAQAWQALGEHVEAVLAGRIPKIRSLAEARKRRTQAA